MCAALAAWSDAEAAEPSAVSLAAERSHLDGASRLVLVLASQLPSRELGPMLRGVVDWRWFPAATLFLMTALRVHGNAGELMVFYGDLDDYDVL